MSRDFEETMKFQPAKDKTIQARDIISSVYKSLEEKGYDPINQIIGYILSGDPTYITSYNDARSLISKIERDELLEEILKEYINIQK